MLPYWQENLRVQMLRNYQSQYKNTAESLSQCWANKWFLGCSYPKRVHDIIDKWPAPRKEDVDDTIKLANYVNILHSVSTTTTSSNTNTSAVHPTASHQNAMQQQTQSQSPSHSQSQTDLDHRAHHAMDSENEDIDLYINPTQEAQQVADHSHLNTAGSIGLKRKRNETDTNESRQPSTKKLKLSAATDSNANNVDNTLHIAPSSTNSINNAEIVNSDNSHCIKAKKAKSKKSKRPRWG